MQELILLGDEAVALGALHAGISAAYGYPGTPSTEIMEYLLANHQPGGPLATWCTNEKTALEAALGVSFAGRRSIVTMKHVGLNVAADPFINAALLAIKGGLVVAVADDPGMHSSQNEQDSRFYAAFALIPCLEPRSQQAAYDMTREAFELSERLALPVLLRLTTRLSHARSGLAVQPALGQKPLAKADDKRQWMLLPAYAKKRYQSLIDRQPALADWSADHPANRLELDSRDHSFVVVTSGLGGNYYEENLPDLVLAQGGREPARLQIGAYPLPENKLRRLCAEAEKVLVIEEGMPFIEEKLRGILPTKAIIKGKLDGSLPRAGELDPDKVRRALGLPPRPSANLALSNLPGRPPQLCRGCPHADSYEVIKQATAGLNGVAITSDIGCYALGALPPYDLPETIVCMGASVSMAKGAADAGLSHVVAVIGDSTFLHSGLPPLIDAIAADSPMTLAIFDNSSVAMTGCQETILPSERLEAIILGLGVKKDHLLVLEAKRPKLEANVAALRREIDYRGLSVVIFRRACIETLKKRPKQAVQL